MSLFKQLDEVGIKGVDLTRCFTVEDLQKCVNRDDTVECFCVNEAGEYYGRPLFYAVDDEVGLQYVLDEYKEVYSYKINPEHTTTIYLAPSDDDENVYLVSVYTHCTDSVPMYIGTLCPGSIIHYALTYKDDKFEDSGEQKDGYHVETIPSSICDIIQDVVPVCNYGRYIVLLVDEHTGNVHGYF